MGTVSGTSGDDLIEAGLSGGARWGAHPESPADHLSECEDVSADEIDVLDLRGQGAYMIVHLKADKSGRGYSGRIQLCDGSGFIDFVEIGAIVDDRLVVPVALADLVGAEPEEAVAREPQDIEGLSAGVVSVITARLNTEPKAPERHNETRHNEMRQTDVRHNEMQPNEARDVTPKNLAGSDNDVLVKDDADPAGFDTPMLIGAGVTSVTFADDTHNDGIVRFRDGSSMTFAEAEEVVPCFTPGTTIATPRGDKPVEQLRAGDRVITRDNGIQEIRWLGRKDIAGRNLIGAPHLRPVLIKAGSLGHGLPEQDMVVSPNHRMLVASDLTQLYFDEPEVFAAAKHMVGAPGVHVIDMMKVSYIHFMFDRHEVVLANGAWTESFQPGDYSLMGIGNSQRLEIMELFPDLQQDGGLEAYVAARKSLKKDEAHLLLQ